MRNRYAVMAATEPAASRQDAVMEMRQRAMTLMFGDQPTPGERLAIDTVLLLPKTLPGLAGLTDEEMREALRATMLRILRVP